MNDKRKKNIKHYGQNILRVNTNNSGKKTDSMSEINCKPMMKFELANRGLLLLRELVGSQKTNSES